jgi:hypothetical protein
MQDSATGRGPVGNVARLLIGATAALMILAVPAAAALVFAPRSDAAPATDVSIAAGDDLVAYGIRAAATAAPDVQPMAKPAEAPATVQLQNWEYTKRHKKPSIHPPD